MRASLYLLIVGFLLSLQPTATAQRKSSKPASNRTANRTRAPAVRLSRANDGIEIVFLHSKLSPIVLGFRGDPLQDRATLAPGVEIRIPARATPEQKGVNSLHLNGKPLPIDFSHFFTDETVWTHDIANNIKYQIGRGYYNAGSYWLFGLAKSHGKTYLGVCWYSPAASMLDDVLGQVFRLDWDGKTLTPVPVHAVLDLNNFSERAPLLDTLSNGDLLMASNGKPWQMDVKGIWRPLTSPSLERFPGLSGYDYFWRRGPWLVAEKQTEKRGLETTSVVVLDAATRRKARTLTWTIKQGNR